MRKYTKELLKSQLLEYREKYGQIPTHDEWKKCSSINGWAEIKTFTTHFGGWLAALQTTFKDYSRKPPSAKIEISCTNCGKKYKTRPSQAVRSKNHYCSRSCSATYNNKNKTHGTRRAKLEIWLEDQLIELYPDLEIHFNRKDTIGSELDIYFPTLNLAIELNGIFHYEPIYGEKKLNQIQENDQNKFQACQSHGISLCIIDTSGQKYFKPKTSQKYLDIIIDILNKQ